MKKLLLLLPILLYATAYGQNLKVKSPDKKL